MRLPIAIGVLLWLSGHGAAQQTAIPVDLELVIAVDTSYSMDPEEQGLQRQGYIDAFQRAEIVAAIAGGQFGRIAVTYVEWGGSVVQVVPWTVIDSRQAAAQFAHDLSEQPITRISFTSISTTIAVSRALLHGNNFRGVRQTIDISGDGPNNSVVPASVARNVAVAEGITINGLPIVLDGSDPSSGADLDAYYRSCVIGGPGAFVITVTEARRFSEAILSKLLREISGPAVSRFQRRPATFIPVQYAAPSNYDCLRAESVDSNGHE
jgi:hypothetical protein